MTIRINLLTTTICSVFIAGIAMASPLPEDLLAGPTVTAEEITNEDMQSRKHGNSHVRQQVHLWMTTLKSIDVTSEQDSQIKLIVKEFHQAQKEYRDTHGKEIAKIREEFDANKKDGDELPTDSRQHIRDLMSHAPVAESYQERVWILFTLDQQKSFQTNYQTLIEEEMKRREKGKHKDKPRRGKKTDLGFSPEDSMFPDRRNPSNNKIDRNVDSVDAATLRRIKFLRRLQELQSD